MEFFYIVTAVLFLIYREASAVAADIACKALKNVVIRSLFPMMVLTRLIAHSRSARFFTRLLSRSVIWKKLNLSDELLPIVVGGFVAGIPSSARDIGLLLKEGRINEGEAKKALALSSLPSPAFVILVASESVSVGVVRYFLLIICAYFSTLLFRSKKSLGDGAFKKISFTEALFASCTSALSVSASIVFFTSVTCLMSSLMPWASEMFAALFEMGSGVIFADGRGILTALCIGWCGLSAMAQIHSEAPSVSLKPYVFTRIISIFVLLVFEIL